MQYKDIGKENGSIITIKMMPNNIEIYHGKKNIRNIKYSGKIGKISILENFYGEIAKIEIWQKKPQMIIQ